MPATLTSEVLKVTNGVCGVTHTATAGRTLCGRDFSGMLNLSEMGTWERIGWDTSSKGACMRCAAAAAKHAVQVPAPITVHASKIMAPCQHNPAAPYAWCDICDGGKLDTTPAGIYAAMMRANSTDAHGLVELLGAYLRRTLAAAYGTVAAKHVYVAITSSGEASPESIAYGLESVQFGATENVTVRDLRTGDTVDTDMGPVLLGADSGERGLLSVRHFTGRILSVSSVPDQCTWILRSNVSSGHTVDYWAVQGISSRTVRRYV